MLANKIMQNARLDWFFCTESSNLLLFMLQMAFFFRKPKNFAVYAHG